MRIERALSASFGIWKRDGEGVDELMGQQEIQCQSKFCNEQRMINDLLGQRTLTPIEVHVNSEKNSGQQPSLSKSTPLRWNACFKSPRFAHPSEENSSAKITLVFHRGCRSKPRGYT